MALLEEALSERIVCRNWYLIQRELISHDNTMKMKGINNSGKRELDAPDSSIEAAPATKASKQRKPSATDKSRCVSDEPFPRGRAIEKLFIREGSKNAIAYYRGVFVGPLSKPHPNSVFFLS